MSHIWSHVVLASVILVIARRFFSPLPPFSLSPFFLSFCLSSPVSPPCFSSPPVPPLSVHGSIGEEILVMLGLEHCIERGREVKRVYGADYMHYFCARSARRRRKWPVIRSTFGYGVWNAEMGFLARARDTLRSECRHFRADEHSATLRKQFCYTN